MFRKNPMNFRFVPAANLDESCFYEHSIWSAWEEPEQNEVIANWGIDVDREWELAPPDTQNEYCFPYLGLDPLPLVRGIYQAADVFCASGHNLFGYLTGGFAFAVFFEEQIYRFNINMSAAGKESAAILASRLGLATSSIFPLKFKLRSPLYNGKEIVYEKFW